MSRNSKRKNTQKDILFILISSFVVIAAWIGFNLYQLSITSTISETIQTQLTPIDPNFDPATIQQLTTRENINPLYVLQASGAQSQPSPTQTQPVNTPGSPSVTQPLTATSGASNTIGK